MTGRLEAIWLKRAHRGPMDPVDRAALVAGGGIEGNADRTRRRPVTIVDRAAWDRALAELGTGVDPSARRANLLVAGVELAESRGRLLAVGPARIRIGGETRPCERMDEAADGLRTALDPEWRAGVYGTIEAGGDVAVGDAVGWVEETGA